jgi:glyoxylate reductase
MMVKPKVVITRKIPEEALVMIRSACEVDLWDEEEIPIPREILLSRIADADGLFCLLTETVDEELLEAAKKLKVVSNMAVGYNNIDVTAATGKGILVTNTPGVLTETTADLTFALLLASARRLVEASDYMRMGKWKTWSPMQLTGRDVYGSTLGIIGLGKIGEAVARRARGFGMDLIYHSNSRKMQAEAELGIRYADLNALLEQSDFVVVLTPYTKDTANLIGREQLARMKSTAILINTARGGIVNEQALYEALTQGTIWGAGLDVFENEPARPDHQLLQLANVTALPHIGSATVKTRTIMAKLAADNLVRALSGEKPQHLVNPQVRQDT